ncbi:sulfur carrier protein ThiS [Methylophilus sp. Leaf414]|uniref:sulfur carrier protein ThiS n=1 Tax=Methylophilus sp. Leaf414 TaxID=1736371 RepID=UPI0006FA46D0|nr:sulfur carrier protein ThiS [Methylophilus sp. Leaf414]KQT33295.1 thiamine biosynthesis protein ThiS [Methylophilus sp. Leaf414]
MQILVNGKAMQLPSEAMTVLALVEHMQLVGKRIAIERNGDIVPRSQFPEVQLQGNDRLEIVGAVGGG